MNKEVYNSLFDRYKAFILEKSIYAPRVVKNSSRESAYFPLITFPLKNYYNNAPKTQKNIDRIKRFNFTIDIYARDITINNKKIPAQLVIDELTQLTHIFFDEMLNMNLDSDIPTPNLDTEILRQTIQYSCGMSNRGNIYR